MVKEKYFIRKI